MRSLLIVATALMLGCSSAAPWNSGDDTTDDGGSPGDDAAAPASDSGAVKDSATTTDAGATEAAVEAGFDAGDGFDQFQHHNLDTVNMYRAKLSLPALKLDATLCTFALAGSNELSTDHSPHAHFIAAGNDGTLWTSGFTSQAGENQGDPNGWYKMSSDPTTNELDQIDDIQKAMYNEGPGTGEAHGHYENMMSTKFKRLGVGLLEVSGELYLTNDFSD